MQDDLHDWLTAKLRERDQPISSVCTSLATPSTSASTASSPVEFVAPPPEPAAGSSAASACRPARFSSLLPMQTSGSPTDQVVDAAARSIYRSLAETVRGPTMARLCPPLACPDRYTHLRDALRHLARLSRGIQSSTLLMSPSTQQPVKDPPAGGPAEAAASAAAAGHGVQREFVRGVQLLFTDSLFPCQQQSSPVPRVLLHRPP